MLFNLFYLVYSSSSKGRHRCCPYVWALTTPCHAHLLRAHIHINKYIMHTHSGLSNRMRFYHHIRIVTIIIRLFLITPLSLSLSPSLSLPLSLSEKKKTNTHTHTHTHTKEKPGDSNFYNLVCFAKLFHFCEGWITWDCVVTGLGGGLFNCRWQWLGSL